tara:strand:+ start:3237 stop:4193 length:957 start_codon:yes stop_codon:yes gene_type:complete
MKHLTKGLATASLAGLLAACSSQPEAPEPEPWIAQEEAFSLQGISLPLDHQIQRYVAMRWGNWGRGGAAKLQPAYVHVLLGEDDPQGSLPITYERALELRGKMDDQADLMEILNQQAQQAHVGRQVDQASALKMLMEKVSVPQEAVGLTAGAYATEQPSAEAIAASGQQHARSLESEIDAAKSNALQVSRERETQQYGATLEDMQDQYSELSTSQGLNRIAMACAGHHELLKPEGQRFVGDYLASMLATPEKLENLSPQRCPGIYVDAARLNELASDMCQDGSTKTDSGEHYLNVLMRWQGLSTQDLSESARNCLSPE